MSVAGATILAAVAVVLADTQGYKAWVAVLVFAATAGSVLQQRARWQEKVRAYGSTVAELNSVVREFTERPTSTKGFRTLVVQVEDILAREQEGWSNSAARDFDASRSSPIYYVDRF
jgi:hypothetical protein